MTEPVKIVVFVQGGVVQDVMTCGVPCEVAVIDADDDEDNDRPHMLENYPEDVDSEETYTANGFVWRLTGEHQKSNWYALECFNIANKANGGT